MLSELYEKMPKRKAATARFEAPIADVMTVGTKTTIKNFDAFCSYARRKPAEVAKFVLKELAVPGVIEGGKLVLQGKFSQKSVADRLNNYVKTHVLCKECGKPDTTITLVDRNVYAIKCEACGAKSTVRN